MIKIALFFSLFLFMNPPAYLVYNGKAQTSSFEQILDQTQDADIILFGEYHNNPICHWLELKLAQKLHQKKQQDLILAGEFFETDDQIIINEYLSGQIKSTNFEKEVKLWNNYATDYKPLIEFAKTNKLHFIASNVPRRYAAIVAAEDWQGLEKLSIEAKTYIAPLPIAFDINLPMYQNMLQMMGGHSNQNIVKAQALKDATMANSILKAWKKGKTVLHFNGAYHSDNYEGIIWYLKKQNPQLKILSISTLELENVEQFPAEKQNLADFIIAVPADMTKTY